MNQGMGIADVTITSSYGGATGSWSDPGVWGKTKAEIEKIWSEFASFVAPANGFGLKPMVEWTGDAVKKVVELATQAITKMVAAITEAFAKGAGKGFGIPVWLVWVIAGIIGFIALVVFFKLV